MTQPSIPIPIAIIGAGCHFPGGRDLDAFFQFLLGGGDAIAELPPDRYDASLYYDAKPGAYGKSYCWRGAMLDVRDLATPVVSALSPEAAARLDPLQKVALGVAGETFASAGLSCEQLAGRDLSVILGVSRPNVRTFDHAFVHAIEQLVAPLDEAMAGDARARDVRAEVVQAVRDRYGRSGDAPWPPSLGRQVAGLVANAYGLTGRHAVIDAACASTFAALATGKRALEQRSAGMVLVGAAAMFDPYTLVMFAQSRALTGGGSYPFDARANGFVPGEGCGMFLLERLDDALAHGRRILGVIRAVGSSCDGSGKGTWAPRKEGQVLAIERAYADGHVDPAEVEFVEAHATSTRLGDATEIAALGEFFGRHALRAPLLIGSVKGNIGHALSAAGAAGLAKVLGAFRSGVLPPTIGYRTPNPDIHWERVPLRVATTPSPAGTRSQVAALDSFGIGGLNYHVIVEGPPSGSRAEELVRRAAAPARARVAIVGAGSFLAGARSNDEFARVVASGTGRFRRLPASRVALDIYHQAGAPARWRTCVVEAALVDEPEPDAQQLKIPPKLLANYDPLQFIILDAANQAFAGLARRETIDRRRVAVFVGSSQISDFFIELTLAVRLPEVARLVGAALAAREFDAPVRARILAGFVERARRSLPALTEESSASVASGLSARTAKALDVNGPVFTIDSGGTGAALAALEVAVEALRSGDCDVAIAGGGDRALRIDRLAQSCAWAELAGAPPEDCQLPGEGAAMVVLRRQGDAVAAGDTILATVAAIGSSTAGSLARARGPSSDAVERAVARAFERADVAPASVQYLVTDVLGPAADAPDLVALERRYGDVARDPLPLGSAPALFGHCDGATGMISLQMALVALRQGAAPPARALRARAGGARGRLQGFAEPIPLGTAGAGAVAVTSAGDWGTQYHVVLGAPPGAPVATARGPARAAPEPFVFRAASRAALWAVLQPLRGQDLSRFSPGELIGSGEVAVAIRASSPNESLEVALTALTSPEAASVVSQGVAISEAAVPAATCFLFPGLGSPYEGMLRALVDSYPAAARRLAEIDALVGPLAGRTMSDVLEHEPRLFGETVAWAQFASLTANLVTFEVAAAHGFAPAFVSGHSFGEYAALVVAGAISLEHAVGMAAARAEHIARTTRPGAMTSVFASRARTAELLEGLPGFAAASNINSPDEMVVSGDHEGTAALLERCRREDVQARQLAVPAPFHCELLRPACEPFARAIAELPIRRPSLPVISTATSREIVDPEQIRRALVEQLVEPVDFIAQIEYAYARGVRRFIETGAGNVLARLTSKILGRRPAVMVSFDERRKREKTGIVAVENALVVLRASEGSTGGTAAPVALAPVPPPVAVEPSALFTTEEWRALADQPDWEAFWVQARPSLALFARDLYARSRPAAPGSGVSSAMSSAPPQVPQAEVRPKVKMFDATAMRRSEPERAPAAGPPETIARRAAPPSDRIRLVEEVSGFLTDLVVKQTGYPRELVRFDQELEADLGIDTVKQVELLGTIREQLDLPADESVTVSDLPTLAELRDYVISKLSASDQLPPASPADLQRNVVAPADPARLVEEVGGFLIDLVVKQTGYPRELVRFDQELEADLGIDTVKQVELLGTIREQLDLPADESVTVSDLPTLAELRDYVAGQLSVNDTRAVAGASRPRARAPRRQTGVSSGGDDEDSSPGADAPLGERIDVATLPGVAGPAARVLVEVAETSQRFVPRPRLEPLASPGAPYRPARVVLVGEGPIAGELAGAFEGRGVSVARLGLMPGDAARGGDPALLFAGDAVPDLCLAAACGRVPATRGQHLAAVAPLLDGARLERLVELVRGWLRRAGSSRATLSAVTSLGGCFGHANLTGASLEGAGLVGLLRALRHEHPMLRIKAVDVDAWSPADGIARALLTELDGACPKLWAGWFRGERRVPALVPTLPSPIDDERLAQLRRLPYVLVTGGARGITAELAVRLAELGIRRLHLVGRTALPGDLLRWRSLAASGQLRECVLEELRASGRAVGPAAWSQGVARIEAALEIEHNLHRIESLGTSVRYHAIDVGDRPRVAELLAAVRGTDGPVRAIVHGAGTQRARALLGKPLTDFHDTLAPKLAGAVHLMELTAGDPIELFVCFSSVAGQFGNLGQTDYGLASAALDALAAAYATAFPSRRACAIAWPAWDEVGMAVRGGTREQLERRGRRLMSVAEGGNHFVREILGAPGEAVVTIAGPSVGDPDEQRPAPARLEELHRAAQAAALPLVDAVVAVGPGEIEVEHHAHPALDAYLVDHVLGGAALLPGVVGLELLGEAASAARGGESVDVLEDVVIERPFKLALDGHGVLRARARPEGDGHAVRLVAPHVDRSGRLVEAERVLVQGRARRGLGRAKPLTWREIAGRAIPYRYRTAAEANGTHVLHGPSLQTLVELIAGDDRWHAARLRALPASALRGRGRGAWCVPAPVLDGCLAACGALLDMRGISGLPRGFGRVELLRPPRDGEECRVLLHELAHDEREAHFDFTAWGADGRVLFVVEDFVRRAFA